MRAHRYAHRVRRRQHLTPPGHTTRRLGEKMSRERPLERRMAHPPRGSSVSGRRFVIRRARPPDGSRARVTPARARGILLRRPCRRRLSVGRPCGAATGGEGSSAGRAPGCGPGGRGFESRPSPQPRDAPAGAERRPSTLTTDAGVAELVDALDLGSGELCSWRFKSSHPHHLLSPDPRTDHTAVRSATAATADRSSDRRRIHSEDEGQPYRRERGRTQRRGPGRGRQEGVRPGRRQGPRRDAAARLPQGPRAGQIS